MSCQTHHPARSLSTPPLNPSRPRRLFRPASFRARRPPLTRRAGRCPTGCPTPSGRRPPASWPTAPPPTPDPPRAPHPPPPPPPAGPTPTPGASLVRSGVRQPAAQKRRNVRRLRETQTGANRRSCGARTLLIRVITAPGPARFKAGTVTARPGLAWARPVRRASRSSRRALAAGGDSHEPILALLKRPVGDKAGGGGRV